MKWFASLVILVCVGFFGGEVWADDGRTCTTYDDGSTLCS